MQLLAKNMAANKKTPYVILYWFSFKIILCMLILCAPDEDMHCVEMLGRQCNSIGLFIHVNITRVANET